MQKQPVYSANTWSDDILEKLKAVPHDLNEWTRENGQMQWRVGRAHSGRFEQQAVSVSSGTSWVSRSSRRLPVFRGRCFTNVLYDGHDEPLRHEPDLIFPSVAKMDVYTRTWLECPSQPSCTTGLPQRWFYRRQPQWNRMFTAFLWSYRRF